MRLKTVQEKGNNHSRQGVNEFRYISNSTILDVTFRQSIYWTKKKKKKRQT